MKNVLLALALFAFTASAATASEGGKGDKGKKAKKATTEAKAECAMASTPSCCMKKDAKTSTAATTPAAKPATKSL
ncbi:hypothetical protein [Hymenobacter actinosclerus]|uniref:Pentapeptide MXKDX repeat protein n=1 Tax=Hymenobacter actinosclerus TaxID=82805 RepID=A0A1I0DPV1_9BACT|nr:hypothetical protein [Hymenobacter actinosclerus]SET34562.1 hypothetical protein SAMN04487998_1504 [Hymenobacter actinosclerus]